MALRVMRAFRRFAPGAGAAGDARDEEARFDQSKGQERDGREQRRRGKASGVRDVRRLELAQMLRYRTGELREAARSAVRVLVDALVGCCRRIAEVSGDIDDAHAVARGIGAREQPVHESGGNTVWRRREERALALARDERTELLVRHERELRIGATQVRKGLGHRFAGLAVRHESLELEARMAGNQARQLPRHVAGAAEDETCSSRAHSTAAASWACASGCARSPRLAMTRSPSAAPSVMALNADTFICSWMICTPTWLSVAGPVTTQGSMANSSRNSLTPPQAATGSLADSTSAVIAERMSSHLRME